ncbi:unnamed protein product [Paramecium octaurelia]|uniref:Uncharacterized protein n=1 Tax=Paramecium octaurelia TaxID=43137 RepID=A0A8S1TMQ5_PAROT|nr:unnamed protein product [Paramecium octaurelia]
MEFEYKTFFKNQIKNTYFYNQFKITPIKLNVKYIHYRFDILNKQLKHNAIIVFQISSIVISS